MGTNYDLHEMPPDRLLSELKRLVTLDCARTAELLAHLAEVDARKLYLGEACSSMFTYCVERLHMEEPTAYKRIEAARAARRFPALFDLVAAGQLHLTGVVLLSPKLTEENAGELLAAAVHRSKREILRLLAIRFPQPDIPADLRKVPVRQAPLLATQPAGPPPGPPPPSDSSPSGAPPLGSGIPARTEPEPAPSGVTTPASPETVTDATAPAAPSSRPPLAFALTPPTPPRPEIKPLSEDRYYLKVTLSRKVHDKLLDAQALLRHTIPSGDLERVLDRALDSLLCDLRRQKFGETSAPRMPSPTPPEQASGSRRFPNADRRQIIARDGLQCSFVDEEGNRCQERAFLELDHIDPVGKGGASEATNGRLLCHRHNMHQAAKAYGADWMRQRVAEARKGRAGPS